MGGEQSGGGGECGKGRVLCVEEKGGEMSMPRARRGDVELLGVQESFWGDRQGGRIEGDGSAYRRSGGVVCGGWGRKIGETSGRGLG
uniref:Uncharacterized protein n=1 Tax=Knipowitschia caucasica TaxID=637954 RepID=A0AAV2LCR7_KNICA